MKLKSIMSMSGSAGAGGSKLEGGSGTGMGTCALFFLLSASVLAGLNLVTGM